MTTTTNIPTNRMQRFVYASAEPGIDAATRHDWMGDVQGRLAPKPPMPVSPEQRPVTSARPVFGKR
jgi:hypothetical protein